MLAEALVAREDSVWFSVLCANCVSEVKTVGGPARSDVVLVLVSIEELSESLGDPRDAQRDALLSELALDLPLTNCHRAVLEPSESRCKQTDKNDEMACSDHQLTRARLLSSRCASRGRRGSRKAEPFTRETALRRLVVVLR